jgi:hypothetical protein
MASLVKPGKGVVKPTGPGEVDVLPSIAELKTIEGIERRTDRNARLPALTPVERFEHKNGRRKVA